MGVILTGSRGALVPVRGQTQIVREEAQRALDAQYLHEDICATMANYLGFSDSDDSESDDEINDEL